MTAAAVNTALAKKADLVDGKIPTSQLPSYVDDVVEYTSTSAFPATGESGKIYIATDTNKTYRWSGSAYVEISESLALGETASTAYAGNKGKANAAAIAAIKDGTNIDSFADVESALGNKVDKVSGKGLSTNDYTTTEKNKLAGIASGAEVNVQSDWSQSDSSADNYIKNKPTIPTVNNATLTIQKNGTAVGTFSANAATAATINITVPVDAEDVDALPDTTKYGASLSLSINSTTYVVTASLKDQNGNTLGTAQTIDLPLETVVVGGSYDDTTKKVILTLKNGTTVDFSVADLVAGLQTEITSTNKLNADLVDDTTSVHKFVTAADKSAWNAKSNFSGSYNDLTNKPTLGTAAVKGVDTAPTASSTNLVESGGVRNVVDVLEQMNGAKNRVNINVSEVKSLNSALGYTWNGNSCTVNGVTFTINNDNTITTSGVTQSGKSAIFTLCDFGPGGTSEFYGNILSGCARGGNYSTSYSLYLVKPNGNTLINNDNSTGVEIPKTGLVRYLRILFRESTSADNLTFKPMICTKANYNASSAYAPYAKSNLELTKEMTRFGVDTVFLYLPNRTFTKTSGGLFYSDSVDLSGIFSDIYAVTIRTFSNIGNISIQPVIWNTSLNLIVCDPSSPQTLSFTSGDVTFTVFGRLNN